MPGKVSWTYSPQISGAFHGDVHPMGSQSFKSYIYLNPSSGSYQSYQSSRVAFILDRLTNCGVRWVGEKAKLMKPLKGELLG